MRARAVSLDTLRKAITTLGVALLVAAGSYVASGVLVSARPAFALSAQKNFSITSTVYASTCTKTATAKLYPGGARCLVVSVHDPLSVAIHVSSLSMSVTSFIPASTTPHLPACLTSWLTVPANLPQHTFTVGAGATHVVTAPIELQTTGTNQDNCENGTFDLAFSGSASFTDTTFTTLSVSGSGHQRTLHATVTPGDPSSDPYGPGSPTAPVHHVSFYACATSSCTTKSRLASTATVTLTTSTATTLAATATATVSGLAVGTHTFEVVYPATAALHGTFAGSSAIASTTVAATPTFVPPPPAPPGAAFAVTQADTPGTGKPVVPKGTIDYTIEVKDVGGTAGTATVTDPLPSNVTLTGTPACTTSTSGDTCAVTVTGSTLTTTVHLAAGDVATATFGAVVAPADTSSVTNAASITSGPCTGTECSAAVTNPVVVLSVTKSSTPTPHSVVPLTTRVTYTLRATDSGTAATTPVTLTDEVPAGTIYVSGSATCGGAPGCSFAEATGTVTWTGVVVQPGSAHSLTVSFAVVVDKADTTGERITNTATFTNDGTPSCTTPSCATNTVTLVVSAKSSAPSHSTPPVVSPIPAATTPHTGEPFAGSSPFELAAVASGLGLLAAGEWLRRRGRKAAGEHS